MSKPSYLPLLNSIAVNEAKGQILLQSWADTTEDAGLKSALEFVAIREGEHAMAFTKRMCELGYPVDEASAYQVFRDFDGLVACVSSDASDAEKVAMVTGGNGANAEAERADPFRGFFNDVNIDPETGALLGRYIAEERDSGRRLQAEYARVCNDAAASASLTDARTQGTTHAVSQEELCEAVASLTREVAKLRKKVKKLS